jgi:hypothetical protein
MYAVKLYRDVNNPENIPDEWPAELRIIASAADCVPPEIAMNEFEYQSYLELHSAKKEAWNIEHGE